MNCRTAEHLVSAARDGRLAPADQDALAEHLAGCADCRRFRETLDSAAEAWRDRVASAPVPDARLEWQRLQRRLSPPARRAPRPRIWWGLSLAAAAGLVFALWTPRPVPSTAEAPFVEVGEGNASATVYVDGQTGWLVVWAVDADHI